ncbi:hypothetical protein [Actinoplanes sp. NPDC049802]|uniref:hypothetical protein n=1 Tax=Actinoplanes sp. NPDC049802 TaxID=3154742 RepID=UPI0033F04EC6
MWVWIAVVAVALLVMIAVAMRLRGRLFDLQRAARRLQHRQEQALALQAGAERLEATMAALQERAEQAQGQVAQIQAGLGRR